MIKRLSISLFLAIILTLSISITVLAIDPPTVPTPTIDAINVYRDCVEENDQLYVIEYTINYGVAPDEVVSEAYIFRLMDGATELKSSTAYPYYDSGYGVGIASIYFSAAEITAKGMGWMGAYTTVISGNPTLTWTGTGCPYVSSTTYDSWNDPIEKLLGEHIMYLAQFFTVDWGWTATPLYESSGGTMYLSALGEDYFSSSIPNLMTMQPDIFSATVTGAEYHERANPLTYAGTIDYTYWAGTWINDAIQPTATALDIDLSMAYGGIWAVITLGVLGLMIRITGFKFEILLLVGGAMTVCGSLVHFLPMLIPIMIGVLLILAAVWTMFWKPSSA